MKNMETTESMVEEIIMSLILVLYYLDQIRQTKPQYIVTITTCIAFILILLPP